MIGAGNLDPPVKFPYAFRDFIAVRKNGRNGSLTRISLAFSYPEPLYWCRASSLRL